MCTIQITNNITNKYSNLTISYKHILYRKYRIIVIVIIVDDNYN